MKGREIVDDRSNDRSLITVHSTFFRQLMARPSRNTNTNWLIETGQMWKLYVALLGFGGTLLCFLFGAYSLIISGAEWLLAFVACGTTLGVATGLWMLNALRCFHCRNRLVWTMIKAQSHTTWLLDLVALESCPQCHRPLIQPVRQLKRIK